MQPNHRMKLTWTWCCIKRYKVSFKSVYWLFTPYKVPYKVKLCIDLFEQKATKFLL